MAGEALTQLLLVKLWENAASTYEGAERPEHPEIWEGFSQLSTGSQHSQKRGSEAQNEVSLQPTTSQTIQEYQGSGYSEANQSPLNKMIFLCLFKKKKKKSPRTKAGPSKHSGSLPAAPPAGISSVALANKGYPTEAAPSTYRAHCMLHPEFRLLTTQPHIPEAAPHSPSLPKGHKMSL